MFPGSLFGFSLKEISEAVSVTVAVMAALTVPYSLIALRIHNKDPRVVRARNDTNNRLQPALSMAFALTRLFILGIVVIVANYVLKTHVFSVGVGATAEPPLSYLSSMVTSVVVLVILVSPSFYLMRLKMWAINRTVARSDTDGRGT